MSALQNGASPHGSSSATSKCGLAGPLFSTIGSRDLSIAFASDSSLHLHGRDAESSVVSEAQHTPGGWSSQCQALERSWWRGVNLGARRRLGGAATSSRAAARCGYGDGGWGGGSRHRI
ncbi:hypothetical protein PR202_gb07615 [Eleusine coracana subsp. coracana]|uniref:Uncharacterized protein n=1 Tax=Eleusine coracana subsp. coracana TaxID=191504 RepID=A0AAV5EDE1_ELECO|nr:hypothetical protein PR202_gb07615 [Eleusine coracana subsp. coracana]